MAQKPLGLFDSGSGGLTVLQSITHVLPHESVISIADHAYNPYGGQTKEVIRNRVLKAIQKFISYNVKLVIIACNTATVAGIEYYRQTFPDIPIVGVVPVIKTAAQKSSTKHIAILTTKFTQQSAYQKKLIDTFATDCQVTTIGSERLVPLIEQGHINDTEIYKELQHILGPIKKTHIDTIALGCTHYPFLAESIRSIVGNDVEILDSGDAVARQVKRILVARGQLSDNTYSTCIYYTTGNPKHVQQVYSALLKHDIQVQYVRL